jgi:broad specificity phosphatase PhoE
MLIYIYIYIKDTELNSNGQQQAKDCGERLKDELFDYIYCSDLNRCKQTAAAILTHHPHLSIGYHALLRERDFGQLSGKPLKYLSTESRNQDLTVDQFVAVNRGESETVFQKRISKAWQFIVDDATSHQRNHVLVVTHGGPLRHLARLWVQQKYVSEEVVAPVAHGNTAVTRVDVTNQRILEFNSTSHLSSIYASQPPPPAV